MSRDKPIVVLLTPAQAEALVEVIRFVAPKAGGHGARTLRAAGKRIDDAIARKHYAKDSRRKAVDWRKRTHNIGRTLEKLEGLVKDFNREVGAP
jgi:hypothetical protein